MHHHASARRLPWLTIPVVLAGLAGGLAVPALAASKAKTVACTLALQTLAPPTATTTQDFGTAHCATPLGSGLQTDSTHISPSSPAAGTLTGTYRVFFDNGSLHGTFKGTFTATASGAVTYTISARVAGGTAAYRHARGTGSYTCTSANGGTNTICKGHDTLTGV
jgi:hypothetical protein